MRQQIISLIVILSIFFLLDYFVLTSLLTLADGSLVAGVISTLYIIISGISYFGLLKSTRLLVNPTYPRSAQLNLFAGFGFTVLVNKLIYLLLRLVLIIIFGIISYSSSLFFEGSQLSSSWWATLIAALLTIVPFLSMIYGITRGKYRFTVDRVEMNFKNLPARFNGFTIAQISDIHSGTWDDPEKVAKGIAMIQEQKPDIILFTGDLVNSDKDEINPYIDYFARLTAPYGKFAVLGNHDYYGQPKDPMARKAYWQDFFAKFDAMGFDLIMNDNRLITIKNESIRLIGVENWGGGRWFPKIGDLDKALQDVDPNEFALLMSHDPSHWDEKVLPHPRHVDLTLSGHTHGMQFGINQRWLRWSPVKYRYKRWIGLHEVNDQKLYINRGFGFLGFPGRVGMWPEITMITLKKDV
jgi:uncharacterized protein